MNNREMGRQGGHLTEPVCICYYCAPIVGHFRDEARNEKNLHAHSVKLPYAVDLTIGCSPK